MKKHSNMKDIQKDKYKCSLCYISYNLIGLAFRTYPTGEAAISFAIHAIAQRQ